MTLEGGIKGWVKGGPQYTRLMDGYKQAHWDELFAAEEKSNSSGPGQAEAQQAVQGDTTK